MTRLGSKTRRTAAMLGALALMGALAAPVAGLGEESKWAALNGPPGGTITSIVVSPIYSFDSSLFVATSTAGVFRSSDRGGTFGRLNTGLTDLSVNELAVSPKIWLDGVIFAATGSGLFKTVDTGLAWSQSGAGLPSGVVNSVSMSASYDTNKSVYVAAKGSGVYRSLDGGLNWTRPGISGMTDLNVIGVRVSPANSNEIFAWSQSKVFRSVNSATTWTEVTTGLPTGATFTFLELAPDFASSQNLLLGTAANGLYRSTDSASNWASVGVAASGSLQSVAFSPGVGRDNNAFVTTATGGVFRTTDRGDNWTATNTGLSGSNFSRAGLSNVFPSDRTVFAANSNGVLYRSTDAGTSWIQVGSGITATRVFGLGFSSAYATDSTLIGATQSGVFRSTDGGSTWTVMNSDLPEGVISAFAPSPGYPGDRTAIVLIANRGVYRTFTNGLWWERQNAGLSGYVVITPRVVTFSPGYSTDLTAFVGGGGGAFRSTNGGATWTEVNTGITYTDISAFGLSPAFGTDRTAFAGSNGGGIFKSVDGGQTWSAVNTGITNGIVNQLAASPAYASDRTVLAATEGGLMRSTDGGSSWQLTGLTGKVLGVALSPAFASDRFAFAITAGPGGKIYGSNDGGQTWSELGTALGSDKPVLLTVSPNYAKDRNVFVATSEYGTWVYTGTPK